MGEESNTRNWGLIGGAVLLIAIIVGLLYYYFTSLWIPAIGLPILIFGIYEIITSFVRSSEKDMYGTSDSGAATIWGFLFIAIGGGLIVFQYANNIIFPIVYVLAILVLLIITRLAHKGKS